VIGRLSLVLVSCSPVLVEIKIKIKIYAQRLIEERT